MDEPAKYVIRATVTAKGVVERNDVVGAIFGQTEGLLGDELDLHALQEADRVGRIEVDIESAGGRSTGEISIGTEMDRAETAVLAAALETIERVGPARATVTIDRIEDVRAAKRREIVDRARELLAAGFEDVGLGGQDLVAAVRRATSPAELTEYRGLPAGPSVAGAEELIVVEGRADVQRLLECGITNVLGVEGTGISESVAPLTEERTVTVFFDGDRGGDLLLLELAQMGDIDYVTFAPPGRSVEDLSMAEVTDALARKVTYDDDGTIEREEAGPNDDTGTLPSLSDTVTDVIDVGQGDIRLIAEDGSPIASGDSGGFGELLDGIDANIWAAVIDDVIDQPIIDAAARHGLSLVIGRERGDFVKRPTGVRILTAEEISTEDGPTTALSA